MEQWERNFYISCIAGANNGSSLVVMSKGDRGRFFFCLNIFILMISFLYRDVIHTAIIQN